MPVPETLEDHRYWVNAITISPDGKVLASGSWDNTVLWDATTGARKQTLEGHNHILNAVAFSPDGKIFASGSEDGTVRLWDATTADRTLETDTQGPQRSCPCCSLLARWQDLCIRFNG
jgi:WD40 repeat protein